MGTDAQPPPRPTFSCSFCDADQNERQHLIKRDFDDGRHVTICEECLSTCFEIVLKAKKATQSKFESPV